LAVVLNRSTTGTLSGTATFAAVAAAIFAFFFASAFGGRAMPTSSRRMALNLRVLQKEEKN
jgi:hypothetical protein